MSAVNVLFVCLGNICRSPTAHGIFETMVDQAGLGDVVHVDSAGTSSWHIGAAPDRRSVAEARQRGYDLSLLRARQVQEQDFTKFQYILAMDTDNLTDLQRLRPHNYQGHLGLFLQFSEQTNFGDVPDPYHGGKAGFELVLNLVEDGARGLLHHIQRKDLAQ